MMSPLFYQDVKGSLWTRCVLDKIKGSVSTRCGELITRGSLSSSWRFSRRIVWSLLSPTSSGYFTRPRGAIKILYCSAGLLVWVLLSASTDGVLLSRSRGKDSFVMSSWESGKVSFAYAGGGVL